MLFRPLSFEETAGIVSMNKSPLNLDDSNFIYTATGDVAAGPVPAAENETHAAMRRKNPRDRL